MDIKCIDFGICKMHKLGVWVKKFCCAVVIQVAKVMTPSHSIVTVFLGL